MLERSNRGPGDSSRVMDGLLPVERSDSDDKSGAPQTSHASKEGWLWNVQRGHVTLVPEEGAFSTPPCSFAE
jgi:hypothetical protein